jgi:hypothetical protein
MVKFLFFFFKFHGVVWGETEYTWYVGHSWTYCTTSGWYMIKEYFVQWELTGETDVLGENLPQCHHLSVYGFTALELGRFFSFLIHTQSVGLFGWGIGPSQGLYLHTEQHRHRINAHRHPCLEWDSSPRSQVFKREKTVHALDRAATVISPSVTMFTTNPTRADLGSDPHRRGGYRATNIFGCCTARMVRWLINSELEKIEVLSGHFPGRTEGNQWKQLRIAGDTA